MTRTLALAEDVDALRLHIERGELRAKMPRQDCNLDASSPIIRMLDPGRILVGWTIERGLIVLVRIGEHALGDDLAKAVGALAPARAALEGVRERAKQARIVGRDHPTDEPLAIATAKGAIAVKCRK